MSRTDTLMRLMGVTNKRLADNPLFEGDSIVIAGYASVPVLDSQGETLNAADFSAIQPFLNGQYRNLMYEHTALQVGVIVDSFKFANGSTVSTHACTDGLFVVAVLRNDAPYMHKIISEVLSRQVECFSVGGIRTVGGFAVHEVSICRRGANKLAKFSVIHK